MKLRNKKTGEIKDTKELIIPEWFKKDWKYLYEKLKWLLEDWEDLDKRYWYIDVDGEVMSKEMAWFNQQQDDIGNRFETREEAEKAVEKLKAWKRLKDICNIKLSGLNRDIKGKPISVNLIFDNGVQTTYDKTVQNIKDLTLLFGGDNE